jgi:glycosyltransferase involved in cell wall biosynthesis
MNSKLMLITNLLHKSPKGGRELLCKLNYNLLDSIYKDNFSLFELRKEAPTSFFDQFSAFKGYIDGVNKKSISRIVKNIEDSNVDKVLIDGSNLGRLAKEIKNICPTVKIYTFFHNVEAKFFLGAFRQQKSFYSLIIFLINYIAEKKSIKYSDYIICLSERDSCLLGKWHGRIADYVSPMSIQDKYTNQYIVEKPSADFALFVGGDFYANISGVRWYVENVAPNINIETYIVGKGMDKFKEEFEANGNIKVIGEVDSLENFYLRSTFVVAPIFDGSGMKTKIAEALMFGKKVIGTSEAFSGYERVSNIAGEVCNSAQEFINAINNSNNMVVSNFDSKLREAYKDNYSFSAAKKRFRIFLNV